MCGTTAKAVVSLVADFNTGYLLFGKLRASQCSTKKVSW